jgi:hypothetical protein
MEIFSFKFLCRFIVVVVLRLEIKRCARVKNYSGVTPPYSFMGCCLISLIKNICLVLHPVHLVPVCTYSSIRLILGCFSHFRWILMMDIAPLERTRL